VDRFLLQQATTEKFVPLHFAGTGKIWVRLPIRS
jgi:hypothetical protein